MEVRSGLTIVEILMGIQGILILALAYCIHTWVISMRDVAKRFTKAELSFTKSVGELNLSIANQRIVCHEVFSTKEEVKEVKEQIKDVISKS